MINKRTFLLLALTVCTGIVARFALIKFGHNYDLKSYVIVAEIMQNGGNVYAETARYNYGPVWFNVLGLFKHIADSFPNPVLIFRLEVVALLTAVDLCIALLLRKYFGNKAFILFFLNPVSIVITGYHNQFDNIAILFGLLSAHYFYKYERKAIKTTLLDKRVAASAVLLAISLATKHLFFALPLWFALRAKSLRIKLFVLLVPLSLFGMSFLPYAAEGGEGIINNVFMYKSFANAPFYNFVLPSFLQALTSPTLYFLLFILCAGVVCRSLTNVFSATLVYLVCLVMFAPAIANQYLAIAMPAIAATASLWFIPYILLSSVLLLFVSTDGIHIVRIANWLPRDITILVTDTTGAFGQYNWIIATLFLGALAWLLLRAKSLAGIATYMKTTLKRELSWQIETIKRV